MIVIQIVFFLRRNIAFAFNDVMKENESITTKVKRHFSRRYVTTLFNYHFITHYHFFLFTTMHHFSYYYFFTTTANLQISFALTMHHHTSIAIGLYLVFLLYQEILHVFLYPHHRWLSNAILPMKWLIGKNQLSLDCLKTMMLSLIPYLGGST